MAGLLLRAAASALRSGLESSSSAARTAVQQQQRRSAHELHVKPNKHVESWLSRREDIEGEFKWDKATTRAVLLGAFVLPIATYNMLVYMAHQGALRASAALAWRQCCAARLRWGCGAGAGGPEQRAACSAASSAHRSTRTICLLPFSQAPDAWP